MTRLQLRRFAWEASLTHGLSAPSHRLLLWLAEHVDMQTLTYYGPQARVARRLGVHHTGLIRLRRVLEAKGLVETEVPTTVGLGYELEWRLLPVERDGQEA